MIVRPCAKVNLGLNVVSKRADGYHDLETVFYPIPIHDTIEIEPVTDVSPNDEPCRLSIDGLQIEGDAQSNLVVRAYNLLRSRYHDLPRVAIKLTKAIPSQAGMGGGSADCAFTITALNKIFNLGMQISDMQSLAATLGADCAFFVNPVPSYATGIGEQLTPISVDLSAYTFAIVKPPLKISTKEAFANIKPRKPQVCCKDIVTQPVETWRDSLINDFEESIAATHKEIAQIKQTLYSMGAIYAAMSGSGSALFGIFRQPPTGLDETFKDCFTKIIK